MKWPDGDPYRDLHDYGWYALRFGWTPAQVDELPAWIDARLPQFAEVYDQVMSERRG